MDPWLDFLAHRGARLEQGRVTGFDAAADDNRPALAPLTDRGVLRVRGPDTDTLLQGQLTCDVMSLASGDSCPGALCDTKGRMFSSFLAHRAGDEEILLAMHEGLVETTRATLAKFAPFYKVELEDAGGEWRYLGAYTPGETPCAAIQAQTDDARDHHCLHLADELALVLAPATRAETLWEALTPVLAPLPEPAWERLVIAAGYGEVRPETSEAFLPQMLNLQVTGGISFRKGCYTGQEVVARMHYRGKLKRRMYRLAVTDLEAPAAGTQVADENGRDAGTVVMASTRGGTTEILAVLTGSAAAAERLEIGGQSVAVENRPLPYDAQLEPAGA